MSRYSFGFVLLGFLLACGDGAGPGQTDRICSAPLPVFANNSVTPTVGWTGGCRVNQVEIRTTGPLINVVWAAFFPTDSNLMVSPIEYGVAPNGAGEFPDNPEPLTPGQTYTIDVSISDTAQGGTIVRVGSTNLTVSPPD
jgi:hypothetical protein